MDPEIEQQKPGPAEQNVIVDRKRLSAAGDEAIRQEALQFGSDLIIQVGE